MKPKRQKTLIYKRPFGKRKGVGNPRDARPGDLVTYFAPGYYTREVREVLPKKDILVTEPLTSPYGKLDDSHKINFEDIDEIIRLGDQAALPPDPPPPDPPPPDPKKAAVKKTKSTQAKKPGGADKDASIRIPGAALRPGDPGYRRSK